MGIYLNPGNEKFKMSLRDDIYVDKTRMIEYVNGRIGKRNRYLCVSRPRRFGKTMTVEMLTAYYSKGCDSRDLFAKLKIAETENYEEHLNQYNVIFLNMQEFLSNSDTMEDMISLLKKSVLWDLLEEYPDYRYFDTEKISRTMYDVYMNSKCPFVMLIDEWDCVFREYKEDKKSQDKYLDFLRDLLKDKEYINLTYMTGILPIKKYGTHSALNMFEEYTMINPRQLGEYIGFIEEEVTDLCKIYNMNPVEMKDWYDGYKFMGASSVYNPRSVVAALTAGVYDTYWNQTETFEALRMYIDMNFEGLREDVLEMLAGRSVHVKVHMFTNDMVTFRSKDDVLTLLVHLGYLIYDRENETVSIPNNEIRNEYSNAIIVSGWGEVSKALHEAADTLDAILEMKEERVANAIERAHFETSHIQYNDENALSYTISLALFTARNFYNIYRELPTGKRFADMVYIPKKKFAYKPAIVMELKWDKSAKGAIEQIKNKEYCDSLKDYKGNVLLVGINYDKKTRKHECVIESYAWHYLQI
ncbi:MAG: ATP-binding protein [Lachnospiraceae bacterium]|nr:ATP-binding protein [Lachnospiraceae bacterium]